MERPLEGHQSPLEPAVLPGAMLQSPPPPAVCVLRLGGQHVTDPPTAQWAILSCVFLHLWTESLRWGGSVPTPG